MPAEAVPAAVVPAPAPEPSAPATEDASPVQTRANAAPAERPGALAWVDRWFIPAAIGVLLVATAIRLPELGLNPFHHDEGVNGWFTTNLVRTGSYFYDPQNYHGPSLYYLALASEILLGLTDTAMRLVPVVFGVLTVAIVLGLRPALGSVAALVAAALIAISPGMVYISRYFIHEMLLVAGTAGFVASVLLYLRTGKPPFVISAAVALAVMATTKESWIIELAVLGIAAVATLVYVNVRTGKPPFATSAPARRTSTKKKPKSIWVDGVEYRPAEEPSEPTSSWLAARGIPLELIAAGAVVFACIYVLLFTSFFTNAGGLGDSFAALTNWAETGGQTQIQPIYQYLAWMLRADAPIVILGVIGGLFAAIRGRDRLWVFIGLWALGITLAYSIPAYKTPWIAINMLLPLALLGGHAIHEIASMRGPVRYVAPLALVAALGLSAYQAIDLNYRHYDDETYPYVFVHSTRQTFDLLNEIDALGAELGTGAETGISIVSPDYWPLPWYLRDHRGAAFWGYLQNESTNVLDEPQPLVISNTNQRADVEAKIAGSHTLVGTYTLRPGVELDLWAQSSVAGS
ncbi:MAG TPA: flippase activity-associated protein Agl23 [Candidatus Limnocylindrales bacterium]|nr:flippase activity-associated protein Agl23 [Candidatus Limnocylindrales bacterium]